MADGSYGRPGPVTERLCGDAQVALPQRSACDRLYNFSMLMFDDLPWARERLPELRRLQASPNPNFARSYRQQADALERALLATEADLKDLERELRHVHA
jgi:hypothetical protein